MLFTYLYDADNWKEHSANWWGPEQGSKGNGSAMRDSIIGPYFGQRHTVDFGLIAEEARLSAEVTHYHPEPIAGSVAVAVAAAIATFGNIKDYWGYILMYTPAGIVRDAIKLVSTMNDATNWQVICAVGNGTNVTALDTVPFALWQAHKALTIGFESAMKNIVEVGGDTDTVSAMVGGIIGNKVPPLQAWIDRTELLPLDVRQSSK